jgi:hypothetical protein
MDTWLPLPVVHQQETADNPPKTRLLTGVFAD